MAVTQLKLAASDTIVYRVTMWPGQPIECPNTPPQRQEIQKASARLKRSGESFGVETKTVNDKLIIYRVDR